MAGLNISNADSRLCFENAVNLLVSMFVSKGMTEKNAMQIIADAMPAQGYLRSEVALSTSVTNYHIPILVNDQQNGSSSGFATEKRLQLQDIFVPLAIKLSWAVPATAAATGYKAYTWENPTVLTTAGASAAMLNLWNGSLNMNIDNRTVIPAWDLQRHYFSPITQQNANIFYTTSAISVFDSMNNAVDGFYPMEPNVLMNGGSNIQATIVLPGAIATLQAGTAPRLIFEQRGILLQNVTSVK